jgi:hypothetical protein
MKINPVMLPDKLRKSAEDPLPDSGVGLGKPGFTQL